MSSPIATILAATALWLLVFSVGPSLVVLVRLNFGASKCLVQARDGADSKHPAAEEES